MFLTLICFALLKNWILLGLEIRKKILNCYLVLAFLIKLVQELTFLTCNVILYQS